MFELWSLNTRSQKRKRFGFRVGDTLGSLMLFGLRDWCKEPKVRDFGKACARVYAG